MRMLLSLAWKNLLRHRRRTLVTAVAIATGLAMYIWVDTWLQGVSLHSEQNLVNYQTGSYVIMHPRSWQQRKQLSLKHGLADAASIIAALQAAGWTASARISFAAEAFFAEGSLPIRMVGIDPSQDARVFALRQTVTSGRYLRGDEAGIMIGKTAADNLHAVVGDTLSLRCRTRHGSLQTLDLQIVGILNTPNPAVNGTCGFAPLDLVSEALDMEAAVTEIAVKDRYWRQADQRIQTIASLLRARFPELEVHSWKDQARGFLAALRIGTARSSVFLLIVMIIAAVGISNTMILAVSERGREIATMRALGMDSLSIRLAFLLEAGGIGLVGAAAGIAMGAVLALWITRWGVDMSPLIGNGDIGFPISGVFRGAWHPINTVYALAFGIVSSLLFSILPVSRALKRDIPECLQQ